MDDNNDTEMTVKLLLKIGHFVNDDGSESAGFKMDCQYNDEPAKGLFEVFADASMMEHRALFEEHLGNLAVAIIQKNIDEAAEERIRKEAAQERVRINTEALH